MLESWEDIKEGLDTVPALKGLRRVFSDEMTPKVGALCVEDSKSILSWV